MKYIVNGIGDLFSIYGSVSMPVGMPEKTVNGYYFKGEGFEAISENISHSSGVTVRSDRITNISQNEISFTRILSKFVFNSGDYEVYTQYSEWCDESLGRWQPLVTEVGAGNDDIRTNCGSAPFVAIYNLQNGRGAAFHLLADSKWSINVKKCFSQTGQRKTVTVELGIDDRGFDLKIAPGETFELPKIIYYDFKNKTDMDAYKLHRYYNDVYPARELPIIYDSWLSKFDLIGFDILSEQLEVAKKIGAEYFVIDAGWFGKPAEWFDKVGDWKECTDCSMMGRMREFADKVRSYGLKFGLWFEIERAALASDAVKKYPQYYVVEGNNAFVDFRNAEACEYIFAILAEKIKHYGIEFIKFDFNAEITFDSDRRSFLGYFEGYNAFIKRIGKEFPEVYLENCASGGLRMSLASLNGFDSFWMSDNHSLYTQLDIFKNTMLRMPSRALERWITIRSLENFEPVYPIGSKVEKILVSGDAAWGHMEAINADYLRNCTLGGPIGVSCDLTKLSENTVKLLSEHFSKYKNERDFWKNSECHILCDTETLLVLQFCDREYNEIKLCSFTKIPHQNAVTVYPVCDENASYVSDAGERVSGETLVGEGADMSINDIFTSGIICYKKEK